MDVCEACECPLRNVDFNTESAFFHCAPLFNWALCRWDICLVSFKSEWNAQLVLYDNGEQSWIELLQCVCSVFDADMYVVVMVVVVFVCCHFGYVDQIFIIEHQRVHDYFVCHVDGCCYQPYACHVFRVFAWPRHSERYFCDAVHVCSGCQFCPYLVTW